MARRKETIWQRDFSFGSVRPEAIERDDTDLIERSTKASKNTILLSTGQIEARPGTIHMSSAQGEHAFEVDLGAGAVYDLNLHSDGLTLFSGESTEVYTLTGFDWTTISGVYGSPSFSDLEFWVIPDQDRGTIIIGCQNFPMQALYHNGANWVLSEYEFSQTAAGVKNIPFYRHFRATTIRPTARTGSITITSPDGIFTSDFVGTYIRYADKQIKLTTFNSGSSMGGDVIDELPPTKDISVASSSGFQIGDAVEGQDSGGQGFITEIVGNVITVLATSNYTGFIVSEKLIGPNAISEMTAVADASLLAQTFYWDMQLWNPIHGYAGTAAGHVGRLFLGNFPATPNVFAASAAQDVTDFSMGASDGDGFVEAIAPNAGGVLRHIVSAEDLLFFTSRGLLFQTTRDGSTITPANIAPVRFSRFGCSVIPPVVVDDAAIFVDASGNQIKAAALAGDIYQSWKVLDIAEHAPHVFEKPKKLGATATGSEKPEMFIYVVHEDGTAAVCQWARSQGRASWRPWDTDGQFRAIYQVDGKVHAVVDRVINSTSVRLRERFEYSAQMDCMASLNVTGAAPTGAVGVAYLDSLTKLATHLNGHTCPIYFEGFDMGDLTIGGGRPQSADGNDLTYPSGNEGFVQIGLHFNMEIIPWARRSISTQRGLRAIKRLIQMFVTVQDTGIFEIDGRPFGDYFVGEDLSVPPPLRSGQEKVALLGAGDFPDIAITRPRPGPFRLLKLGYRVSV